MFCVLFMSFVAKDVAQFSNPLPHCAAGISRIYNLSAIQHRTYVRSLHEKDLKLFVTPWSGPFSVLDPQNLFHFIKYIYLCSVS